MDKRVKPAVAAAAATTLVGVGLPVTGLITPLAGALMLAAAVLFLVWGFVPSASRVEVRLPLSLRSPQPPPAAIPQGTVSSLAMIEWGAKIVGHDIYLAITNHKAAEEFRASVEHITGTTDPYPSPFPVRWHEHAAERCEIQKGETRLLHLARVEPEGDADDYPIEHGAATKASVERRARHWKPARFRFMGLSKEYVVYLDLGDVTTLTGTLRLERYERWLRVSVRVRSADETVNETRTVALGIQQVGQSRLTYGQSDAVVAEIEAKP